MFLGVETSLTGRRWVGPDPSVLRAAEALSQNTDHPPALCQLLAQRGVDAQNASAFLAPSIRELLPDPHSLKDVEIAGRRIVNAIRKKERVAIFADYDVDGGSSAALLISYFRHFGIKASLYVPDRIEEGYGPNAPAMQTLARDHDLIICVDCGTLSHDALAAAHGTDILVLDHHLGGETLPPALAVVNPNRQDEDGDLGHLCAAGVVFLVLVEVRRQLRDQGVASPDLMQMLDLVALATVADVAPLVGVNRAFVTAGLRIMAQRARTGLVALSDVANLDRTPEAYHLGFVLGPRINAGGRVGAADLGARLLSTDDPHEAAALAERLDKLNAERRAIEASVREAALEQTQSRDCSSGLVWAADEGWHPGVVGIVASRLKETTNRPTVVIGFDGDDGKGSGRSISGIDLGAAIQRLAREGLIEKGGGHKMAAGLSLSRSQLEPAMARLSELLEAQGAHKRGAGDVRLDGAMMASAATVDLIESLGKAGPFGASAPAPRFALPDCKISFAKPVGDGHLKLTLRDDAGAALDAICFSAFNTPLGPELSAHDGARFHIAGRLEVNHWQGRAKPQLRVEDAAPSAT